MDTRYVDLLSGDIVLSAKSRPKLIQNGMLFEVEAKWTQVILHDESCISLDGKCNCGLIYTVLDIVNTFSLQGLPAITHDRFISSMKLYCIRLSCILEPKKRGEFIRGLDQAVNFFLTMLKEGNLLFFCGYSKQGGFILGYGGPTSKHPKLFYFAHGLVDSKFFKPHRKFQTPLPKYHGYLASSVGMPAHLPGSLLHSPSHRTISQDILEAHKTIYQDLLTGDVVLSDLFDKIPIFNGLLWEVDGKLTGIGERPDGMPIDGNDKMATSIIDMFGLKERPALSQTQLQAFMEIFFVRIFHMLGKESQKIVEENFKGALEYLLDKLKDLKFFTGGRNMVKNIEGSLIFQVVGGKFLYLVPGLKTVDGSLVK